VLGNTESNGGAGSTAFKTEAPLEEVDELQPLRRRKTDCAGQGVATSSRGSLNQARASLGGSMRRSKTEGGMTDTAPMDAKSLAKEAAEAEAQKRNDYKEAHRRRSVFAMVRQSLAEIEEVDSSASLTGLQEASVDGPGLKAGHKLRRVGNVVMNTTRKIMHVNRALDSLWSSNRKKAVAESILMATAALIKTRDWEAYKGELHAVEAECQVLLHGKQFDNFIQLSILQTTLVTFIQTIEEQLRVWEVVRKVQEGVSGEMNFKSLCQRVGAVKAILRANDARLVEIKSTIVALSDASEILKESNSSKDSIAVAQAQVQVMASTEKENHLRELAALLLSKTTLDRQVHDQILYNESEMWRATNFAMMRF
jgi:hypothetical protein